MFEVFAETTDGSVEIIPFASEDDAIACMVRLEALHEHVRLTLCSDGLPILVGVRVDGCWSFAKP